jgi:hypothetical protein
MKMTGSKRMSLLRTNTGVRMKKELLFLFLVALFVSFPTNGWAQEKSTITVKSSELNNGVLIVDVLKAGKGYELQCNQGAPNCTPLKGGKYQMIELPSNSGMYDCRDVQVYPDLSVNPDAGDKKIGEYCLTGK